VRVDRAAKETAGPYFLALAASATFRMSSIACLRRLGAVEDLDGRIEVGVGDGGLEQHVEHHHSTGGGGDVVDDPPCTAQVPFTVSISLAFEGWRPWLRRTWLPSRPKRWNSPMPPPRPDAWSWPTP